MIDDADVREMKAQLASENNKEIEADTGNDELIIQDDNAVDREWANEKRMLGGDFNS
jgi:hypothetical protein